MKKQVALKQLLLAVAVACVTAGVLVNTYVVENLPLAVGGLTALLAAIVAWQFLRDPKTVARGMALGGGTLAAGGAFFCVVDGPPVLLLLFGASPKGFALLGTFVSTPLGTTLVLLILFGLGTLLYCLAIQMWGRQARQALVLVAVALAWILLGLAVVGRFDRLEFGKEASARGSLSACDECDGRVTTAVAY